MKEIVVNPESALQFLKGFKLPFLSNGANSTIFVVDSYVQQLL